MLYTCNIPIYIWAYLLLNAKGDKTNSVFYQKNLQMVFVIFTSTVGEISFTHNILPKVELVHISCF